MHHRCRILALVSLVAPLLFGQEVVAQWRPQFNVGVASDSGGVVHASNTSMALAGVGLGFAGAIGGGIVGAAVDRARGYDKNCDECIRWGAAAGVGVGMTVGMALGVHLADHSRGDFMPVLKRTALVNGAFWALSYVTYKMGAEADMVIIPLGMGAAIASAIHVQKRQ